MLKERGQIGQEFSAEEIAEYLKSKGYKPKLNVDHYRNHFGGSYNLLAQTKEILHSSYTV
ncbi:hypothetical protein [Bacillus subtilis]|uniref:hypothetical protein n=1 Tax=Bacillus subtilis TaxID=1423 RepID=UPI002DBF9C3B|nr:hypothetical protein [Bacillus subtilis]MEC2200761.1 hypothetical protein [Bacillus subtilis]